MTITWLADDQWNSELYLKLKLISCRVQIDRQIRPRDICCSGKFYFLHALNGNLENCSRAALGNDLVCWFRIEIFKWAFEPQAAAAACSWSFYQLIHFNGKPLYLCVGKEPFQICRLQPNRTVVRDPFKLIKDFSLLRQVASSSFFPFFSLPG